MHTPSSRVLLSWLLDPITLYLHPAFPSLPLTNTPLFSCPLHLSLPQHLSATNHTNHIKCTSLLYLWLTLYLLHYNVSSTREETYVLSTIVSKIPERLPGIWYALNNYMLAELIHFHEAFSYQVTFFASLTPNMSI